MGTELGVPGVDEALEVADLGRDGMEGGDEGGEGVELGVAPELADADFVEGVLGEGKELGDGPVGVVELLDREALEREGEDGVGLRRGDWPAGELERLDVFDLALGEIENLEFRERGDNAVWVGPSVSVATFRCARDGKRERY